MTEGEKMVWSAAYARFFMDEHLKQLEYGKDRYKASTSSAVEWAWHAVQELRECRTDVIDDFGAGDVSNMLDEMLKD